MGGRLSPIPLRFLSPYGRVFSTLTLPQSLQTLTLREEAAAVLCLRTLEKEIQEEIRAFVGDAAREIKC